jgi:hypothetical protein
MIDIPKNKRVRSHETDIKFPTGDLKIVEVNIPGNDDSVYENNRNVWEKVPRGLAFILTKENDEICVLAGVRKFGYSESTYGYSNEVTNVIGIEKENGECAHVSSFIYKNTKFWIIGSKHVNVVFRDGFYDQDIIQYQKIQRYKFALKIASLFVQTLGQISSENKGKFFDYLSKNGLTANGEAIFADSQHIVDYGGINQIRWFALSKYTQSKDGLSESPNFAREFFGSCSLYFAESSPMIQYKSKEYYEYLETVAKRLSSEGVVMYGMNNDGKVVRLWKEKSYPYVMERVIREAIKRGMVGDELYKYSQKRLSQQSAELRNYFSSWEIDRLPFLIQYAAWLHTQQKEKVNFEDPWSISTQWLSLQRECFLVDSKERDAISLRFKNQKMSGVSSIQTIMLAGPPGSGKSTLARSLVVLLKKCGKYPVWVNQDEAGDRKRYLAAIDSAIKSDRTTHIILDKSNLDKLNRKDYTDKGIEPILTVIFQHPEGNEELIKMCVQRIMNRGEAHRTLRTSNPDFAKDPEMAITKIIQNFVENSDIEESADSSYFAVDATMSPQNILLQVWDQMTKLSTQSDYPIFNEMGSKIDESLQIASEYEKKLKIHSKSKQIYACLKLDSPIVELLDIVPTESYKDKVLKKEFHVTIKYFGGIIDPESFVKIESMIDKQIQLQLKEVVYDDKGVAISIEPTFECDNLHPHFTIATAKNIPPVYSNELLQKTENVTRIPVDKKVMGKYAFM